jgi:hypothetical protein
VVRAEPYIASANVPAVSHGADGVRLTVETVAEATVLLVTRDTGSLLIWPTAIILILSLCLTFYFPQRRLWLRISGQHIALASIPEHFTNIRPDLLAISRAAHSSTHPTPLLDPLTSTLK